MMFKQLNNFVSRRGPKGSAVVSSVWNSLSVMEWNWRMFSFLHSLLLGLSRTSSASERKLVSPEREQALEELLYV